VTAVAVVAHAEKTLDGGLDALRAALEAEGVHDPLWEEVRTSRKVPKRIRSLADRGADLIFVWGGDGTVQRAIDAMVGTPATLAIVPAGTANLLATNLRIPQDVEQAVRIGIRGADRALDVGKMNGEHFAVMAGAGLDAATIEDADGTAKDRLGRLAYVLSGARALSDLDATSTSIEVDGDAWFEGDATCVLLGNVGRSMGGLEFFPNAVPDDGVLDIGVVTADSVASWSRTLARVAVGQVERSPFVQMTTGRRFSIRFDSPLPYELDGGDRDEVDRLKVKVKAGAVTVRVNPATIQEGSP
jgi:YegS/Rv2252/BmrU family lipid kinase